MTPTIPQPASPQPNGADMLLNLALDELGILRMHLTSGWYKVPAVHGPLTDFWFEVRDILNDTHRAHEAIMDAQDAARAAESARCETCGASEQLERTEWTALADGSVTVRWFCANRKACNDRRFPELASMLDAGGAK